jgi:DNA polymerase
VSARRGAAEFLPDGGGLAALRRAAACCKGCDLYASATQTVFGEGPARARLMMVGEQPGDREDLEGHPFVGPAGKVLDRALEAVGLDRSSIYLTNAVKHFKFVERGKRRIHKQPTRSEVLACEPWLEAELRVVKPALVVALGAVAAKALLGPQFKVSEQRGAVVLRDSLRVIATVHPSAVLRAPDRKQAFEDFVRDLKVVAAEMGI